MRISESLFKTELFRPQSFSESLLSIPDQAERSYLRAEAISRIYGLSVGDVVNMSPKFWSMHTDPIICLDGAATTLLTIQYNLAAGTIGKFYKEREDLRMLIQDIMNFKILAQFCLSEVGHGLDAFNLRTTATLKEDHFDLHTPVPEASKYMPPTIPVLGRPCVAVVFAQLVVDGERRGIRPFIVSINDGHEMCKGVSAKLLPPRGGSMPINHAITSFDHVKLPRNALLGSIEKPAEAHQQFLQSIWRVSVGGLALGSIAIPALQIASHIGVRYSLRRKIGSPSTCLTPILSFRTQQIPVFTALAQAYVLQAFHKDAVQLFVDQKSDPRVRQGIASCLKAIMVQHCQASHLALSERCGAQGLFSYNQLTSHHSEMRGIAIAEGDVLVLSIRLATEMLLGRYALPSSKNPDSLLSKHETGLFREHRLIVKTHGHRSPEFGSQTLPQCQSIVEAIGHRMAYDSAVAHGVPDCLLQLYVCDIVKQDLAWYIENGACTRAALIEMENDAIASTMPHLEAFVDQMGVAPYVTAPIIHDESWADFVKGLEVYDGSANAVV